MRHAHSCGTAASRSGSISPRSLRAGRAILDIYLPGDVIGLDGGLNARSLEEVLTLTAVTTETMPSEDALIVLMADRRRR